MSVTIHQSTKFNHARVQYYAEAGGHTLLRLTCGNLGGNPGGAIKTATASDHGAAPVYRDREKLTAALRGGVESLGGRALDVSIEVDGKGRPFGEIVLLGSPDELINALRDLAQEMELYLGQPSESRHNTGYNDLRDLYNDLYVLEGEPVYLSDGVYLESNGHLFE